MRKGILSILIVTMISVCGCSEDTANENETTVQESTEQEGSSMSVEENKTYEVKTEELVIKSGDKEIYGKIYAPSESGQFPAVILSHGYNGCNADFINECNYYAEHGYIAYAYDFSGGSTRSKSVGKSTEMTIFTEKEDLLTVIDYIKDMENVDQSRIFIFGGSQGGLVTTLAAEERKDVINGMILYYPALNVPDDWRRNYATEEDIPETVDFWGLRLGRDFFMAIRDFYTFENIGTFDKDVLIIHGDKDEIVPLSYSQQAAEHYNSAELVVLPGEGHGFTPNGGKEAMELVLDFMNKH